MQLPEGIDVSQLQRLLTPRLTKYIPYEPTAKQRAFLLMNDVKEILYGGAAGGGKSVAQLMAALQFVDIPGYSAILFRKTYADLSLPGALIDMAKDWLLGYKEVNWSEKEKKFTFPAGATLSFGYLESDNDCYRYQGAEFQYIGMDECTHIAPSNYRYLFSRLRKPISLKVPLRYRATCNPGGQYGEYYHQRFFVEGAEKGRVFIGAGLKDNPYLDAEEYARSLDELDPVTRAQLLEGNWEIREGGNMFNREWFTVVPFDSFNLSARPVRYWDFASTDPSKRKNKKDKREPDTTVGCKMRMHQGIYIIDDFAAIQASPADVEKLVAKTAEEDGYGTAIWIEQEPGSSGDITIDHYTRNVLQGYNVRGVRSTGSKVERAQPASAACEQGRVLISNTCRNVSKFFDQSELFPNGNKDDFVDAFSGAFNTFRTKTIFSAPTAIGTSHSYWKA